MLDLTGYSYEQLEAMEDLLLDLRGDPHITAGGTSADDIRVWLRRESKRMNRAICATLDIMAEEWDHRQEEKK